MGEPKYEKGQLVFIADNFKSNLVLGSIKNFKGSKVAMITEVFGRVKDNKYVFNSPRYRVQIFNDPNQSLELFEEYLLPIPENEKYKYLQSLKNNKQQ